MIHLLCPLKVCEASTSPCQISSTMKTTPAAFSPRIMSVKSCRTSGRTHTTYALCSQAGDHPPTGVTYFFCKFPAAEGLKRASQVALAVENPPANAGDVRDAGSVPGLGRSPGEGNGNHSSILAWRISWIEEPGKLQFMESQRVRHNRTD